MLIAVAILFVPGWGYGQGGPGDAHAGDGGWIRPERVPARADALRRWLNASEPDLAARASLEEIEQGLVRLGPDIDASLDSASVALARSSSFLDLEDERSRLAASAAQLDAWEGELVADASRVAAVLDDVARAQRVWTATRDRPETASAGAAVEQRIQASLELLDQETASLQAWRARVLAASSRLAERRSALAVMLEKLRAAVATARMDLLIPRRAPLWRSDFVDRLRDQLPQAPHEMVSYTRGTLAYVERDLRPLIVQTLLAALLMFALGRFAAARKRRITAERAEGVQQSHERPYAVGLLLALLVSPVLHPLAPRRFLQLLGIIALLPAARIAGSAFKQSSRTVFAGLFLLFLLDRIALGLAPLPAVARASFLLVLVAALCLGFWFARRLQRSAELPWLRGVMRIALIGLVIALLAEIGGWANLAALLGRGIVAGAVVGLYVYAAVIAVEPLLVDALSSPTLHRSHLFERNAAILQLRVGRGLRWLGAGLWIYLVLRAMGLRSTAADALRALLHMGVSVGALSLSIGGVLAFVLTLLAAMFLAWTVNAVLEEDVFPRTSLPRGISYVLSTLVRYGVYSLGFMLALAAAGIQLGQLSILLGGFGVGIGLGLQDLVKNFAAGLTLLVERRVHVGDALQIPSQEIFGRVRAIGMRATVVRSWNGSEVVVPNADLISGAVTNWTLSDRLRRVEVPVGVAYGTDPQQVVALLLEVARGNASVLEVPAAQGLFTGFGDSSLDFALRAWTDDEYERTAALISELSLDIHRRLDEAGITIPFPQRDLHLASVAPEVRATLSGLSGAKRDRSTPEAE